MFTRENEEEPHFDLGHWGGKSANFSFTAGTSKGPTGANVPPVSTLKNTLLICVASLELMHCHLNYIANTGSTYKQWLLSRKKILRVEKSRNLGNKLLRMTLFEIVHENKLSRMTNFITEKEHIFQKIVVALSF